MSALLRIFWAISCWVLGTGLGFILSIALAGWPEGNGYGIPPLALLPSMLLFGLPVWVATFLPPFFLIKDRQIFWNPILASTFGAFAGFLGFLILLGGNINNLTQGPADERALAWTPLFIGAFTFLLGSLAKQNYLKRIIPFHYNPPKPSRSER